MEEPNFTIIIPHYNSPDLLKRCISSIPTRFDIEIIIVDDNSPLEKTFWTSIQSTTNNNLSIIINDSNKGAGYARNIGLSKAKGKWVLFCDADDFYLEGFLTLIDSYTASDADIVYFNITSVYSDSLKEAYRHKTVDFLINKAISNDIKNIKKLKYSFLEPFAKLYKREFIIENNISFEEVFFSNDTMFSLSAALYSSNILINNNPIYCVTVSKNSLTNIVSSQSLECRINVAIRANNLLKKANESKYQIPVITFLLLSRKFGIHLFLKIFILLIVNKQNIFNGLFTLMLNIPKRFSRDYRKHSRLTKKYKSNYEVNI